MKTKKRQPKQDFSSNVLKYKMASLTLNNKVLLEITMKNPYTRFLIIFLFSAFAFQFITNSILGPKVGAFPVNGDWFSGTGSPIAWKRTVAAIIYPVKVVLVGPLAPIFNDPDPVPPLLGFFCALYWSAMASVLYFVFIKLFPRKKA